MRYDDWGARSQQWAGLCSVSTSVCRVPVHYVRAEPASAAVPKAPVHLLVPPMTGSASMWIDLVPYLRRFGPVISVDLPGSIAGHTGAPYRRGRRADLDARFVSAFVEQLPLESRVVLHGWSMGGLVAALAAGRMPEQTRGVVLVAPALPWRRTSLAEALGWQTLGRLLVAAGPPVTRIALRLAGQRILDAKGAAIADATAAPGGRPGLVGGDPGRVSRAQVDLWLDGLEAAREHPERLAGTATAFASAIKAMFIEQRPTNEALDSLRVPVLVLWGTDDPLVDAASLMQHARRPGWTPRPIHRVGHLLPIEAPDLCAQAVGQWLADLAA
ncbi:alpha/beta hydrolase [Solirubrobacter sp. CPCC 204708]|uniref:Alpha/beta hydrolase n=1 Tax=Solirubrobacter deserti TaxID=2282478 RepID=A0ABT4RV86_9ACTN|nr:alpha/beta hydrolase [Solirubrobacter deserti]